MERLKLATVWLGGCSGCHMSFLDLDEFLIDLAGMVDIVFTPFIDVKQYPRAASTSSWSKGPSPTRTHLEFVQMVRGAHDDPDLLRRLRRDRQRHRDAQPAGSRGGRPAPVLRRATATWTPRFPAAGDLARSSWTGSSPVHGVVPVDVYIPGCPPPASRIRAVLEQLLGRRSGPARRCRHSSSAEGRRSDRWHSRS